MDEDCHKLVSPDVMQHFNSLNLILFIPCSILTISHIHQQCTQWNYKLYISLKLLHVSVSRCHRHEVSNTKAHKHQYLPLMYWCLYPLVFETVWRWHRGTETCRSFETSVQFLIPLCALLHQCD